MLYAVALITGEGAGNGSIGESGDGGNSRTTTRSGGSRQHPKVKPVILTFVSGMHF